LRAHGATCRWSIRIAETELLTEERPMLDVIAVDVRELALGSGIPAGIDAMIPIERHWKQRSSQAPIYEAV
jgi:5-methylcytosine-specific restriction enzyme subunit McrC